jgi:hypothetical protein
MLRRDFLEKFAGAASLTLGCCGTAAAYKSRHHRHAAPGPPTKLDRIAVSSWSLHNYFRATRDESFKLPGPMIALLDFPELILDRYRIRHFEFCASQFPSTEPAFVREMKATLNHTESSVVNLAVDLDVCGPNGTFSDADRQTRLAAFEDVKVWVDIAHDLGAKSVSVGPGKVDPLNLDPVAESYKTLASYAQGKGIHVMVENQNGFGEDQPEELAKLVRLTGAGRIGTLPNFANFPDDETRTKGLKLFFPMASTVCHAGGVGSGAEEAAEAPLVAPAVEIAKGEGFAGFYTIFFNGTGDPYIRVQKIVDELMQCI